jgi:hypothetical protein
VGPPSPRKRSWKDAAGAAPSGKNDQQGWRPWKKAPRDPGRGERPWWQRKWTRLGLVLALLLAVAGTTIAVVRWFRPVPPVRLILIGAGYEGNLAVPPNVAGRRALDALERWAQDHNGRTGGNKRQQVEVTRVDLGSDDEAITRPLLDSSMLAQRPGTVVVYVAAHGLARIEDGKLVPFLVRQDDDLRSRDSLYPLERLLVALEKLPRNTRKLLLLDATQVAAYWPLGELHNDFARALEEQAGRLRAVPNLVVLSSSGKDERSWVSARTGLPIFAHALLTRLGQAARDGRVDALQLYQDTSRQVEHWAWNNRNRRQRPVLVGDDAKMQERAKNLVLTAFGTYEPPVAPTLTPAEEESLRQAWEKCRALERGFPPPETYTPQLWRRYLDTLLRYEQLLRAGDRDSAARLPEGLDDLQRRIVAARALPRESLALTLTMPDALGLTLTSAEEKRVRGVEQLWQAKKEKEDYQGLLRKLDKQSPNRLRRYLLRVRATRLLLQRLLAEPERLDEARQALDALDVPRPAEAHYVLMLRPEDAPPVAKKDWPLVRRALELRLRAEETALGLGKEPAGAKLFAYSEQVRPWIEDKVGQADQKRRPGQDLLFASAPEHWRKAEELFGQAEALYGEARDLALEVRRGLQARDRALAVLPYYTHWAASQGPDGAEELVSGVWGSTHQLSKTLAQPPAEKTAASAAALNKLSGAVTTGLNKVEDLLDPVTRQNYADRKTQSSWHEIQGALGVPFLPTDVRLSLVRAGAMIARELEEATDKGVNPPAPDPEQSAARARRAAQRQGRLALALLGEDWPDHKEVAAAISRPEEGAWYRSLDRAGERIGAGLNRMPEDAQKRTERAATEDLRKAADDLREASRLARQMPGYAVGTRLTDDPVGARRRLALYHLLFWQARRTFDGYWAADRPDAEVPYFRAAGAIFLRDAGALVAGKAPAGRKKNPRLAQVEAEQERLNKAGPVVLEWSASADAKSFSAAPPPVAFLTDEAGLDRFYRLPAPKGVPQEVLKGIPVRWVEHEAGLLPGGKDEGLHRTVEFGAEGVFKADLIADARITVAPAAGRKHRVVGYFRGHRPVVETTVRLERDPDLTISLPPRPPEGRLAVRARPALYDRYVSANAAIALVLDCSGSMLARGKDRRTRFAKALRALRDVLELLPAGVTVSLRAFSAEQFKGNPQQISLVWPAEKWNPDALDRRMKQLSRLKPYYDTPLIRAIYQARNDFPKGFTGPRTIVALTDGGDSNFYDSKNNPDADLKKRIKGRSKTIAAFLKQEFKDSGIQVRVIGFQVKRAGFASAGEKRAYNELRPALRGIGGSYYDADDPDSLADALKQALFKMDFWVDADEGASTDDLPDRGNEISRTDTAENLRWLPLKTGDYVVKIPSLQGLRQSITIGRGDSLLLELVEGKRRLAFRRSLYAPLPSGFRKMAPLQEKWQLSVLQNQRRRGGEGLQMMATLEKDEGPPRSPRLAIQVVRPRWTWLQVPPLEAKGRPPRLRVLSLADYPAPAWGLNLPGWPDGKPSALQAWWTEDAPPFSRLGVRERGYRTPLNLANLPWPTAKEVTVESVKLEKHQLEISPGVFREIEGCLVVRLRYPPGAENLFFVQLPDRDPDRGQEHRFYYEAGKYTGIFWRFTPEEAARVEALHLISVAEFKKQAIGGQKLELGLPDEQDRPSPPPR